MSVRVIATGGTIASTPDPETGALRASLTAEELVASVPGLAALGPVTVDDVADVHSWNVTPATMSAVSARAETALAEDGVEGVVVTHGTDTLEETAFFCDLTVHSNKPVCFAAAMRGPREVGADGPRNLLAAATVASHPDARGLGTVLTLSDEVHAARWLRSSTRPTRRPSRRPAAGPWARSPRTRCESGCGPRRA